MIMDMTLEGEWVKPYRQLGKHRRKCRTCGKLIHDGEKVRITRLRQEKYYPVKGLMWFTVFHFTHEQCHEAPNA